MYVMVVAGGYPTQKYWANGVFEFDQAKALQKSGAKVVYIALDMRSIRRWRKWGLTSVCKEEVPIEVANIPGGRLPEGLMEILGKFYLKKLFFRAVKKYGKPDIIHCHFTHMGYYMTKVAKQLNINIPIVLTEHSSNIIQPQMPPQLHKIAMHAYQNVSQVIAVSPTLKDVIKRKFDIDAVYIPNMYNNNIFKYSAKAEPSENISFISVANLKYGKGMDVLVKAFSKAFNQNKHVKLKIVGDGPEKPNLQKLIVEQKMHEQIELMGKLSREEIAKLMSESDTFVLLSRYETFGVVYIEALACGLPVIATKCGGPETFVTTDNGILVEVDNIEESTEALVHMAENYTEYACEKIAIATQQKFSPEAVASELTGLYEMCMKH